MRIAHLVGSGELAGGEAVALRLARAARAAGHETFVLSPTEGTFTDEAHAEHFSVERVEVSRTIRVGGAIALARVLRRREVDLLHTHVHVAANILGRLAARAAGAAVVSHLHIENHFRPQRLARAPLVLLDNATARLCSRIIAVSDATREAFVRQGFPAGLIETVHNGVDVESVTSGTHGRLREELALADDAVVIGHVGRLAPVKGQRELIEALAKLRTREPRAVAVLIGQDIEAGGAYRRELERLAAKLGVKDAVHFAGFRPNAAATLGDVDVVALPSWIEGFPLVVLEAMAHGKPVVATCVGGTPEAVVDGETGRLVPPRDPRALEAALAELVAGPQLRARFGEAGKARVQEHFDAAAMEARILEVYDAIARPR